MSNTFSISESLEKLADIYEEYLTAISGSQRHRLLGFDLFKIKVE